MLGNDIVDQLAKRAAKEGADSTDAILPTADVKIDKKQLISKNTLRVPGKAPPLLANLDKRLRPKGLHKPLTPGPERVRAPNRLNTASARLNSQRDGSVT